MGISTLRMTISELSRFLLCAHKINRCVFIIPRFSRYIDQTKCLSQSLVGTFLLCPHHEMVEGQLESALSVCASECVFVYVCVPES